VRAAPQAATLLECLRRSRQALALSRNPRRLALRECFGVPLGSPAWNRDSYTAVVIDAKEIPAGEAVANEIELRFRRCKGCRECRRSLFGGFGGFGGFRRFTESEFQLHCDTG